MPQDMPPTDSQAQGGFSALAILRIKEAQRLNQWAIYAIYVAIIAFVIFGTIASLQAFHDNQWLYWLFYYLPYILVGLTIPISLYNAFVLLRYRLSQPSMIALGVGIASILTLGSLLFSLSGYLWLGFSAWFGVAFLFRANFKRFFKFLQQHHQKQQE